MKVYISGGSSSGKSDLAQNMAVELASELGVKPYYIATMIPCDEEDRQRVARHIESRKGMGFTTCEFPYGEWTGKIPADSVVLLDSMTALVQNLMFRDWRNPDTDAGEKAAVCARRLMEMTDNVIFVSDHIYSDGGIYENLTEEFRRNLAHADRKTAGSCDRVIEVAYGNVIEYR